MRMSSSLASSLANPRERAKETLAKDRGKVRSTHRPTEAAAHFSLHLFTSGGGGEIRAGAEFYHRPRPREGQQGHRHRHGTGAEGATEGPSRAITTPPIAPQLSHQPVSPQADVQPTWIAPAAASAAPPEAAPATAASFAGKRCSALNTPWPVDLEPNWHLEPNCYGINPARFLTLTLTWC